jgi:hypothetical protein
MIKTRLDLGISGIIRHRVTSIIDVKGILREKKLNFVLKSIKTLDLLDKFKNYDIIVITFNKSHVYLYDVPQNLENLEINTDV